MVLSDGGFPSMHVSIRLSINSGLGSCRCELVFIDTGIELLLFTLINYYITLTVLSSGSVVIRCNVLQSW